MDWEDELRKLMVKGWYINIDDARIFISSLLKKQRENCANEYKKQFYSQMNPMSYGQIMTAIQNAPEPE